MTLRKWQLQPMAIGACGPAARETWYLLWKTDRCKRAGDLLNTDTAIRNQRMQQMRRLEKAAAKISDRTFALVTQVSFWALWLCALAFFAGVAINFPSAHSILAPLAVVVVGGVCFYETMHQPSA